MLLLHCSTVPVNPVFREENLNMSDLAFKINSSRADEITFVVRLLHRRRWLITHHRVRAAVFYFSKRRAVPRRVVLFCVACELALYLTGVK